MNKEVFTLIKAVLGVLALVSCSSCASLKLEREALGQLERSENQSRQAVVVLPRGDVPFHATLSVWENSTGNWWRALGPWPAVVGREGFALPGEKREGDGRTPSGIYRLGLAFGREAHMSTGLHYRQATAEDKWVDDVTSPQYNQWVSGATAASSFEQMLRPDGLYDVGAVIEYNTDPVVPGNGSAIFMHIWRDSGRKPTAGCVALSEARLRKLLKWLDAKAAPVILLGR